MTILEAVRALTVGDCPTRREAVKTIREYCEAERKYHKAVDEYREAVKKYTFPIYILDKIRERIELEKLGYPPSAGYYRAIMKCLQIIDKYREPQAESEE